MPDGPFRPAWRLSLEGEAFFYRPEMPKRGAGEATETSEKWATKGPDFGTVRGASIKLADNRSKALFDVLSGAFWAKNCKLFVNYSCFGQKPCNKRPCRVR